MIFDHKSVQNQKEVLRTRDYSSVLKSVIQDYNFSFRTFFKYLFYTIDPVSSTATSTSGNFRRSAGFITNFTYIVDDEAILKSLFFFYILCSVWLHGILSEQFYKIFSMRVLPVPPTVIFPTHITGKLNSTEGRIPVSYRKFLNPVISP